VLRHIVLSKEFAASAGAKPRSPLALAASFCRATGIDLTPTMPLVNHFAQCGQRLFGWPSPDGRPSSADYYLTPEYLRERWNLVTRLAQNVWNTGKPKALLAHDGDAPLLGDAVAYWLSRFGGPGTAIEPFLAALGQNPDQPIGDEKRLAQIAGLCAAAPQFQIT